MIELAVQILGGAVEASGQTTVSALPVRLTLRVLLPRCPERWPLVMFWESASQDNDIGRLRGVTLAFNGNALAGPYKDVWTGCQYCA